MLANEIDESFRNRKRKCFLEDLSITSEINLDRPQMQVTHNVRYASISTQLVLEIVHVGCGLTETAEPL